VGIGRRAVEGLGLDPAFWRGRKVLITGHTGFKGSWLSLWLNHLGAHVVGYSLGIPTDPSLFEIARVDEGVLSLEGDVRDGQSVAHAVEQHRPEIVIHMAAQALVRQSFNDPVATYETNVLGTVNVLEGSRACSSVKAVLVVTSDKCYEDDGTGAPHIEEAPLGGSDPYSSSKACAELVVNAYRRSFGATGPALASVRAGNVIGGGDWAQDRLVPDLVRAALTGREALVRNPDAVRPWQHVLEPLAGYLLLGERLLDNGSHAEAWNFGPRGEDARPVRWVVERFADLWEQPFAWRVDGEAAVSERHLLRLDASKARARLGWDPRWDLERALRRTVEWYRAYGAGTDLRALTLEQIAAYAKSAAVIS
jgi:CDP-glucose 4,6-dehydratase